LSCSKSSSSALLPFPFLSFFSALPTGFQELCRLNSRFSTLSQALFSNAAASVVRDQLNQEELEKLNEAIHEFCVLLVPHFLSSACFQALEYMVRQFK
jgi:hypothetical protein